MRLSAGVHAGARLLLSSSVYRDDSSRRHAHSNSRLMALGITPSSKASQKYPSKLNRGRRWGARFAIVADRPDCGCQRYDDDRVPRRDLTSLDSRASPQNSAAALSKLRCRPPSAARPRSFLEPTRRSSRPPDVRVGDGVALHEHVRAGAHDFWRAAPTFPLDCGLSAR